ncbi:MAG: hypothetical protein KDC17_08965, partial [Actinobacteria bacterium]|nr:hypothetical protein [Actinomycetota bacterium]
IRQNGSEIGRKKDDLPYVLLFCDSLSLVGSSPKGRLGVRGAHGGCGSYRTCHKDLLDAASPD